RRVAYAAPQVDDLLALVVDAAGRAQLVAAGEVLGKGVAHGLKAWANLAMDRALLDGLCKHGDDSFRLRRAMPVMRRPAAHPGRGWVDREIAGACSCAISSIHRGGWWAEPAVGKCLS